MNKRIDIDGMSASVVERSESEEQLKSTQITRRRGRKTSGGESKGKNITFKADYIDYAKYKVISAQNNISIKDMLRKAMKDSIERYEKKFGVVKICKGGDGNLDDIFGD